ncbi:MAG TPA: MmcQ/YjbR family DNA-binding protein [Acidimicrobiales bacterium]|nr:MmcQ/YjbR family DNA-binding protein [Acidimicrobiales bacterium]
MRPSEIEERIRSICLQCPGVTERQSHGAPAFFAGKQFLMLWPEGHHDRVFPHLWCAAPPGAQAELVRSEPDRFFRPPYVGARGWVGVRLDLDLDWQELEAICEEAFRTVAPDKMRPALGSHPPQRVRSTKPG